MAKDWIERRNSAFLQQAQSFTNHIASDYAAYGISASDAALLSADYADFIAAYQTAQDPAQRTSVAVLAQNEARQRLVARMRDLGGRVRANKSIDDAAKFVLSLAIPSQMAVAPDSAPDMQPIAKIISVVSNIITVRLRDEQSPYRYVRPRGVVGAQVFYATGDDAPLALDAWGPPVVTLSSKAVIRLPYLAPGTKVWVCARWFDNRGRTGAISNAVSTYVGGMTIMSSLAA